MRVAACVSGEMRGCPGCVESLTEKVFAPLLAAGAQIDTLARIRLDPWCEPAVRLPHLRHLRVERNVPRLDTGDILGPCNPVRHGEGSAAAPGNLQTGRRAFFYQSYLQYYLALAEVGEMKRRAEEQDGRRYDLVLRVRPDGHYREPLRVDLLTPDRIWTPENEKFGGLSDKFAAGPSEMMDVYFRRRDFLREFCRDHELQAETLLQWQLEKAGVPYDFLPGLLVEQTPEKYAHSLRPDSETI